MKSLRQRILIPAIITLMSAIAAFPMFADTHASSSPAFHCYCMCEKSGGQACHMKMCDLPKYENRSWAMSCHKQNVLPAPATAPANQSNQSKGRPTHRILTAKN
jgi:hypothetical protein